MDRKSQSHFSAPIQFSLDKRFYNY